MAAGADYALTHHFPRLARTHALARRLADGLREAGCEIIAPVDTNMVCCLVPDPRLLPIHPGTISSISKYPY
jgi:threonine aldolase